MKSVTPVEVKEKCNEEPQVSKVCEAITAENNSNSDSSKTHPLNDWLPEVDLSSLTAQQKLIAQKMLHEESDCFSRDDEDIGCCEELQVKINLTDNVPVQKSYNAIPKSLYPEGKQYIEDLLNRKFIRRSKSAYSSPVVCVRKKDGI